MPLSAWSNYDYNGTIFVFGRIDSTLTPNWDAITKVMMSVDTSDNYNYSSDIKSIPYMQTDNDNNTEHKVFNINTYQHRISDAVPYQFSSGMHNCYLRFYSGNTLITSANVTIRVHSTLNKPTVTLDEETGTVKLTRSSTSGSPRYYMEIRRANRSIINSEYTAEEKDYIHTVVMKGIEGGKYNEGIPHTGFMKRGESTISGSSKAIVNKTGISQMGLLSNDNGAALMNNDMSTPTVVSNNIDISYTYAGSNSTYYKFTAIDAAVYTFSSMPGVDLRCEVYSDSGYSHSMGRDDDSGENMSFLLSLQLFAGQTVYVELYDFTKDDSISTTWRINKGQSFTFSPFTGYELGPLSSATFSCYSSSLSYVTFYSEKRNPALCITGSTSDWWTTSTGRTPYAVARLPAGQTSIVTVTNKSTSPLKFYHTQQHSDVDYQPYWRINPIQSYSVGVVFDNAEIMSEYGEVCMAQVNDAITRLTAIISETSGTSIVSTPKNLGVSKLYVSESVTPSELTSRYINSSNKIASDSEKTLYYATVNAGSIYRVSYNHSDLFYGTRNTTGTTLSIISGSSNYIWYEDVGYNVGVDENTVVVSDSAGGYYIFSNEPFILERVTGWSDCMDAYNEEFGDYNILVRFGLDGTTWFGNQGIATSGSLKSGGNSADINGQGKWGNYIYYNSSLGLSWSYATINVDTANIFESLFHVIHEEIAQSLGIGDDCYSHEESIHWDPEYSNPDYYTGIDRNILNFSYAKDKNGYTQFELCNEFDLPVTLFREYSDYDSTAGGFLFHLKDPGGNWLLRSGTYEIYAWCAGQGANKIEYDGWDNDPYSLRSEPITFTVSGGWYWDDYGIDMKSGLQTSSVPYTVWNAFIDAVAEVMGNGTIPADSENYGSAAGLPFSEGIEKAKATESNKTLYAQRFNIVNYIICNSGANTGIGIQKSLLSQVYAEYMIKLQDCRNMLG